jgi:putative endonuclease
MRRRSSQSPPSTTERGRAAEHRVAWHYRLRGYRILARNVRAGGVELDLIVRRGRRLVFVEVKQRVGRSHGDPVEAVDRVKLDRLRMGADAWLTMQAAPRGVSVDIEVVAVRGRTIDRIPAYL